MSPATRLGSHRALLGVVRAASVLIFLLVIVFLLFAALPADPARSLLGTQATEDAVAALRHELGLDRPLHVRFGDYLASVARLELGRSFVTRRPVGPEVAAAFRATLVYVSAALLLALSYSVGSAIASYFAPPHVGHAIQALNSGLTSIPSLVVAVGFGVVFLVTGLFSFVEPIGIRRTLMAATALAVYPGCSLSQILVEELRRVREATFVMASRSFGYSERRLLLSPVFRSASLPWLAQLSNTAAAMVAGSVVIEVVFSLPGLGRLVLQSVLRGDLPMIQGVVLLTAASFLLLDAVMERSYRRFRTGRNA